MKIDSIYAHNFRTLQDIKIDFGPHYCTLSGQNNAGKSNVIRLILCLLGNDTRDQIFLINDGSEVSYDEDVTQWLDKKDPIEIEYTLSASKADDPALVNFVEKLIETKIEQDTIEIVVKHKSSNKKAPENNVSVAGKNADAAATNEILRRLKTADNLYLYNSAHNVRNVFYRQGKLSSVFEFPLSPTDKESILSAEKALQGKIKKLARTHKGDLEEMLGKLSDAYDVEFGTFESNASRRLPLSIKLKDKSVEVPLSDWGSGTQNRTQILLAILHANRIRTKEKTEDRITPIVLVEEPESFLHPSAQAEFGRALQLFAEQMGIQIICATHSAYMLNQKDPSANILLRREVVRQRPKKTIRVPTAGDEWMAPFAEHLGVVPSEFERWGRSFFLTSQKAVLVEGDIDVEYFEYARAKWPKEFTVSNDVEFSPYGGKDSLKNTTLVKFVFRKIGRVFITFDLDSKEEIEKFLTRLNLEPNRDFLAVGLNKPGRDKIEGLLPDSVLSTVNGRETELVMKLQSQDSSERRDAKSALKKHYLSEFKKRDDYSADELKDLFRVGKAISTAISRPK